MSHELAKILGAGAIAGLGTMGAAYLAVGKRGREQMKREVHDPRLYSNLRGAFHESAEERVGAHKHLDRRKDHSVLSAMREGFTRGGHRKEAEAFFDELLKLGAVSDAEAAKSLSQLEKLEANKLTPGQVGRYALLGGVAAPTVNFAKNVIKGKGLRGSIEGVGAISKLRHVAADAAGGAALTGAVPLMRSQMDQRAEVKKLRKYLQERSEGS